MPTKTQHQKIISVHHAFIAANKLSASVNKGEMLFAVCIHWACRLRDREWNELWYLTFNHRLFLTNAAKHITLSGGHLPKACFLQNLHVMVVYVKLHFSVTSANSCFHWDCNVFFTPNINLWIAIPLLSNRFPLSVPPIMTVLWK
jgi:hypothetical protein